MAVAFRNATAAGNAAAGTTIVLTVPTGTVNGDVMLMQVAIATGSSGSVTTPAGWNVVAVQLNSSTNVGQQVFWRVASSEPASYTVTTTNTRVSGAISSYSGVDQSNPISFFSTATNSTADTSVPFGNYNPHTEADFLVGLGATRNATAVRTLSTPSTNFTKRADASGSTTPFIEVFVEDTASTALPLQLTAIGTATLSAAKTQATSHCVGLRAAVTNTSFDIDVAFRNAGVGAATLVSDAFTTGYANEVVVVFAQSTNTASLTLSGQGLTFGATNSDVNGNVSVFWAVAASPLSSGSLTLTPGTGTPGLAMTIYTIRNMDTSTVIGATTTASGATGAPSASVTTTRNASWVWGAVNYQSVTDSTIVAGQTKLSSENNTNRQTVQRQTATTTTSGTSVTISNSAPSTVPFDMVVVELLPVAVGGAVVAVALPLMGVG